MAQQRRQGGKGWCAARVPVSVCFNCSHGTSSQPADFQQKGNTGVRECTAAAGQIVCAQAAGCRVAEQAGGKTGGVRQYEYTHAVIRAFCVPRGTRPVRHAGAAEWVLVPLSEEVGLSCGDCSSALACDTTQ